MSQCCGVPLSLRLGDICFTEIQTTIKMHAVPVRTFLRFVDQGFFNADNLPLDGYSHTTAILLAFIPDTRLTDIECVGNWQHDSEMWDSSRGHILHFWW